MRLARLPYSLASSVSFGRDGSVPAAGRVAPETELANEYGNLASRTLAMMERYRDGVVPDAAPDPALIEGADGLAGLDGAVRELLDRSELSQALEEIWARVRRLNRYVEETRPWDLAKDDASDPPGPVARERETEQAIDWMWSSTASPRACGCSRCSSTPTCRRPRAGCSRRSPRSDRELAAFGSRDGGQRVGELAAAVPEDRGDAGW